MATDKVERLTAEVNELLEAAAGLLPIVDDIGHVRGQHEGGAVPARVRIRIRIK